MRLRPERNREGRERTERKSGEEAGEIVPVPDFGDGEIGQERENENQNGRDGKPRKARERVAGQPFGECRNATQHSRFTLRFGVQARIQRQ